MKRGRGGRGVEGRRVDYRGKEAHLNAQRPLSWLKSGPELFIAPRLAPHCSLQRIKRKKKHFSLEKKLQRVQLCSVF